MGNYYHQNNKKAHKKGPPLKIKFKILDWWTGLGA